MRPAAACAAALALLGACAAPARRGEGPGSGSAAVRSAGVLHAVIETENGEVLIRFLGDPAAGAAGAFARSAAAYAGTGFHRVVPGLLAQGGDRPEGDPLPAPGAEAEQGSSGPFDRAGLVGFSDPVAGGAFFITLGPAPWLSGRARAFGEVVAGMEAVSALASAPRELYDAEGRRVDRLIRPLLIRGIRIEER